MLKRDERDERDNRDERNPIFWLGFERNLTSDP